MVRGGLCGLALDWKYHDGYVDLSIRDYVPKVLQNFQHQPPKSPQFSPFSAALYVKYIKVKRQYAQKINSSSFLPPEKITRVQQIIGSLIYYTRAIDNTLLPALNKISTKQDADTKKWNINSKGVLD